MKQIKHTMEHAELLFSMTEIEQQISQLAKQLNQDYQDLNPLVLCVMNGSVVTLGHLLPKLSFPLQLDYIHATRYRDKRIGADLLWQSRPTTELANRHVLLIEDIFDEGYTLDGLRAFCLQAGASSVRCLALVNKLHDRKQAQLPEYLGLEVADRYVFGFGMDVDGYWRNAPGIFAVREGA